MSSFNAVWLSNDGYVPSAFSSKADVVSKKLEWYAAYGDEQRCKMGMLPFHCCIMFPDIRRGEVFVEVRVLAGQLLLVVLHISRLLLAWHASFFRFQIVIFAVQPTSPVSSHSFERTTAFLNVNTCGDPFWIDWRDKKSIL